MESSAFQTLRALCAFGPRPVGSEANRAAGDYLRAALTAIGLEAETERYACPYWELSEAALELPGCSLDVSPNIYCPACDLSAPLIGGDTLEGLRAADLRGKIVVIHGALSTQARTAAYYCYAQGPDQVIELLKEKQPAAVLTVESNPANLFRFLEDWTFPIPNATVQAEAGRVLLQAAGKKAHLRVDSRRVESDTANIVARRPGPGERRLVICAHFDTAFGTPGALDNASGVAVMLAVAERLAGRELGFPLELVAFSGEDSGGTDFGPYEQAHGDFQNIRAVINIDGVGDWLGSTSITTLGGEEDFQPAVKAAAARYRWLEWVEPWYESDHSMFFFRGVPAVAISSKGFAPVHHRASDTPDWINPANLERVVDLVEDLVLRI